MTMKNNTVLLVFGTRPEAIKMAPLAKALILEPTLDVVVCSTGQHREMLSQVLGCFNLKIDIDLDLMSTGQTLAGLTIKVIESVTNVLEKLRPNVVLVHGDTTTAMATALASFYMQVPVVHVEAGLRTGDLSAPFPEEMNRQVIARVSALHFTPTQSSTSNLLSEGVCSKRIIQTGNTIVDALLNTIQTIEEDTKKRVKICDDIDSKLNFDWKNTKFILITGHRRENFGRGFDSIVKSISIMAQRFQDVHFVYPVHKNPEVVRVVHGSLSNIPNVHLIEPLGYMTFVFMMSRCYAILTDSGGIQEEAPTFNKPVLVMRDKTERTEALKGGNAVLVGTDVTRICDNVSLLLEDEEYYRELSMSKNPFGDGQAARRMVESLKKFLEERY